MKTTKLLYAATLFMLGLTCTTSCSDSFLDMKQDGVYDQLDSETKVNWYINSLYNSLYNGFNSPDATVVYKPKNRNVYTEEAWGAGGQKKVDSRRNYFTLDDLGSSTDNDFYAGYFGTKLEAGKKSPDAAWHQIRYCNIALEQIDTYAAHFDETFANQARGQVYFLRAAQMFDLVRIFGAVPIVTTVISSEAHGEQLPRSSVSKNIEQIANDLTLAATLLPDEWPNAAENYGRATKGAALALKSRVLLTYASPIFNKNWNDPNDTRWQMALKAAQEAVNSMPDKSLEGITSAKAWADMLCNSSKNTDNSEAIFVRLLAGNTTESGAVHNGWENSIRLSSQGGGGGKPVPVELIDAFPKADGTFPQEGERLADGNIRFMLDRDPRFYRTFAFSGEKWGYKQQDNDTVWAYRYMQTYKPSEVPGKEPSIGYNYSENSNMPSPVFIRKMSDPAASYEDDDAFSLSGVNIYEYRYAELALNLAECYAATGNVDECKNILGKLRARVGMEQGTHNYGLDTYITDRASAISGCLRERLIELCYEGKRCWDTWRWLLYDGGQGIAGNGEALTLSQTNTCEFLGVTPLNETCRTSIYLAAKQNPADVSRDDALPSPDPLIEARKEIFADIDAADFQEQLVKLADFWEEHFELQDPPTPGDKGDSNQPINIGWKANYYISGINRDALTKDPWLGQTIGWQNTDGQMGTIGFQDDDEITINWLN